VDPAPDLLLLRKSGSAGNRTRASESGSGTLTTRSKGQTIIKCWKIQFIIDYVYLKYEILISILIQLNRKSI
jgi:hypothetical protein